MALKRIEVLKKNQYSISGKARLGPDGSGASAPKAGPGATPQSRGIQQVRVVESNTDYAILEVTCGCGSKGYVQCNYAELTQQAG